MIERLQLGDHDEATRRAYALLRVTTRRAQEAAVASLVRFMRDTSSKGTNEVHRASSILEAINRLDPSLVAIEVIENLANSDEHAKRMSAAVMLWDRAEVAPAKFRWVFLVA